MRTTTRALAWQDIASCLLLLAASFCWMSGHAAAGPPAAAGKLVISGSSAMAPMVAAVAARFMASHPGVTIEVHNGGERDGIEEMKRGKADIGMASRSLTDGESNLYSFAIARDGLCMVVHKDNPVTALSNRQVAEIYTGKIANWSQVGGKNARIVPIGTMQGTGTVELFLHYFGLRYADIKAGPPPATLAERLDQLMANPGAIAFMSVGAAQRQVDAGAPIRLLALNGVAATTQAIRGGVFPMSRPLMLLTSTVPTGLVKEFIGYSLSSQITDIVVRNEFVPYLD